jgi:hypothetical protein
MSKRFLMVIMGVLLTAGGAQASIGWAQNFGIGAVNFAEWPGGIGSATAVNKIATDQRQQFGNAFTGLSAFQRQTGTLFQSAVASGPVGPGASRQEGSIDGAQSLWTFGDRFPHGRGQQNLTASLTNEVAKPHGVGFVDGVQRFNVSQEQGFSTFFGSGTQSQSALTFQQATIDTDSPLGATATNRVNLQLNQTQTMSGW